MCGDYFWGGKEGFIIEKLAQEGINGQRKTSLISAGHALGLSPHSTAWGRVNQPGPLDHPQRRHDGRAVILVSWLQMFARRALNRESHWGRGVWCEAKSQTLGPKLWVRAEEQKAPGKRRHWARGPAGAVAALRNNVITVQPADRLGASIRRIMHNKNGFNRNSGNCNHLITKSPSRISLLNRFFCLMHRALRVAPLGGEGEGRSQQTYLNKSARSQMHFYHKHNRDPDNGAGEHQPSEHHGPGRVAVRAVGHGLPLVEAEAEDELGRKEEHVREGGEAASIAQP